MTTSKQNILNLFFLAKLGGYKSEQSIYELLISPNLKLVGGITEVGREPVMAPSSATLELFLLFIIYKGL